MLDITMPKPLQKKYPLQFDYDFPTAAEIRDRHEGNIVHISAEESWANICDAVLTLQPKQALEFQERDFWDKEREFRKYKVYGVCRLDTPARFNSFGPEINLNTKSMTITQAKEQKFLPDVLLEKTWDPEDEYRGIGWWGVVTNQHRLLTFLALVEGHLLEEKAGIKVKYQVVDPYHVIDSVSREDREYEIMLHFAPSTTEDNWVYTEWTDMHGHCGCEDSVYRESRKRYDEWTVRFKYVSGEETSCRHKIAVYKRARKLSHKKGRKPLVVDIFGTPTGLMEPWNILKNRTYISDSSGLRRPIKTEANILLGKLIGYAGAHEMLKYDHDEILN
jgi:hypothetical protein